MKPLRIMLIAAVGACLAFAGFAQAGPPSTQPADDAAVRTALRARVREVEISTLPFKDVIQFVGDMAQCKIEVDWEAVKRAKIKLTPQTPVTLKGKNIPAAAALRQVLDKAAGPGALGFVVEHGRALILPKAVADGRFVSHLDADLEAVNARASKATRLVKQLLKARAGLPATRGRVAALERQLRQTAGPVLRQIDQKLREVAVHLTPEGLGPTTARCKAFSDRLNVLVPALETIVGAGAWEPVPPATAGKRRLLFRPDKTSRLKAGPMPAGATPKPEGKWTAEKGKILLTGKAVEVIFQPDTPAAGGIEFKTTLSFKGDKASTVTILLIFTPADSKQRVVYICDVLRQVERGWCELICISAPLVGAKGTIAGVHFPPLKEGKAYPLRLLIRGRKLTCSLANRTVSMDCDPLPAGAKLRYVHFLTAAAEGQAVTLDDFKITCADEGAAGKPKDEPAPAKPAAKATAEQELQAANALKLADLNRKAGLRRTAIKFYEKIVKEYPATAAAKEAKEWLTILRP